LRLRSVAFVCLILFVAATGKRVKKLAFAFVCFGTGTCDFYAETGKKFMPSAS